MRIFKLKGFARWQRGESLEDRSLCAAVVAIERKQIDADLGGGLIKQRVARPGQGKRGGFRTLLAYRVGERVVFLYGFAKSERDNIGPKELARLRVAAREFLAMTDDELEERIADDDMTEVYCDDEEEA